MSLADDIGTERGGEDLTAAEYVLGVLPADEREIASRRLDSDAAFARDVDRWEVHFSPMATAYASVEPPATVKVAVDRRLFAGNEAAVRAAVDETPAGFWSSLAVWRTLALAALAAFALYVVVPYINPTIEAPQQRLVASLAAQGSDVHYMAVFDAATGELSLAHATGDRGANRDFELWMVEGSNAPVSMGVIPVGSSIHIAIPEAAREKIGSGIVLAISREPTGGSPTGTPTEVVAAGPLTVI